MEPISSVGSPPRTDLFQKELDICCDLGWVERIPDDVTGRSRYRITHRGEEEYAKWVGQLLQHFDQIANMLHGRAIEK